MKLTFAETNIYEILRMKAGSVVPTDLFIDFLESIRKPSYDFGLWNSSNLIAVHIRNLRKKLPEGETIETVRGVGYKLIV